MRILLDMDGVLVDFVGGAAKAHGWTHDQLVQVWPPGQYEIAEPMGLTLDEFWQPINETGEQFWLQLEPLPWIHDILHLLVTIETVTGVDWYIATTPSHHSSSYSGKVKWLQEFFGQDFDRFILTGHKHLLAGNGQTVLIDDNRSNVDKFVRAGGEALLFPARWNALHQFADDPVPHLTGSMKNLFDALQIPQGKGTVQSI